MTKPRLPFDIEFLMESVLDESPDYVYNPDGTLAAKFVDGGIAFFAFRKFSILSEATHTDIVFRLNMMDDERISDGGKLSDERFGELMQGLEGYMQTSSKKELLASINGGEILQYFDKFERIATDAMVSRKHLGLSGRAWPQRSIISFWLDTNSVIKKWDDVEKMFSDNKTTLGDLNSYRVDWVERTNDYGIPMTMASDVSSKKNGGVHVNNISPDELKKLQSQLHVMSPQQKRDALMMLGAGGRKAPELADRLGITVAQLHHMANVNESVGIPKLSDIVKNLDEK